MSRHFNDSGEKNIGPLILQAHISWIQMYRSPKNSRKRLNAKKINGLLSHCREYLSSLVPNGQVFMYSQH